jgi:hypothetical protein
MACPPLLAIDDDDAIVGWEKQEVSIANSPARRG